MTISYSGNFCRLLLRWRGSLWKAVYQELLIFLIPYFLLSVVYRFSLSTSQKDVFEHVAQTFDFYTKYIPLTFLLGFYINCVVSRWMDQFKNVAWPDDLLATVNFLLPGTDKTSTLRRHQIARHLCLTCVLCWRDISVQVRRRFPTMEHVVDSGLMTSSELALYRAVRAETVQWQLPLHWIQRAIRRLLDDGKVPPPLAGAFTKQINDYKTMFRHLYCYDWICVPLVYTQVTSLATYGYFGFCLLGRQFLDPAKKYPQNEVDFYIPVFTILQFLFYIGWFKDSSRRKMERPRSSLYCLIIAWFSVGQDLMRPFGTDDDDIELNYILDRHIRTAFATVRHVIEQEPLLEEDVFWNQEEPRVGHTSLSAKQKVRSPKLHAHVQVKHPTDAAVVDVSPPVGGEHRKLLNDKMARKLNIVHKPRREF